MRSALDIGMTCHWAGLGRVILAVSSLLWSAPVLAERERSDNLYVVTKSVADQGLASRQAAATEALLEVLTRLTGLSSIPRSPVIAEALARPDQFYSKFVYLEKPRLASSDQRGMSLSFTFDQPAIVSMMRAAKLPIWWSFRPATLVWVVVDTPAGRNIVTSGDRGPLVDALNRAARERGVTLMFPLMDLEDAVQVAAGDVWGNFIRPLAAASERYQVEQFLVGRLSVQEIMGQRLYSGDWQLFQRPLVPDGPKVSLSMLVPGGQQRLDNADLERMTARAADAVARGIVDRDLVFAREGKTQAFEVTGVTTLPRYKALLDYLVQLEFVEHVSVTALRGQALDIQLITSAERVQLLRLLNLEGRLRSADELSGRGQATARRLEWLGGDP